MARVGPQNHRKKKEVISIDVKLTGKQELNWFENNRILGTLRPKTMRTNISIPSHVLFQSTRNNSRAVTVNLWEAYGLDVPCV